MAYYCVYSHALLFGNQKINLHQSGREFEPKAQTVQPGSGDLCFLTDTKIEEVLSDLKNGGLEVRSPAPSSSQNWLCNGVPTFFRWLRNNETLFSTPCLKESLLTGLMTCRSWKVAASWTGLVQ